MSKNLIIISVLSVIIVTGIGAVAAFSLANSQNSIKKVEPAVTTTTTDTMKEKEKLNGWKEEKNNWYFYTDDEKQKNWVQDKNQWYYLGSDGKMRTGWIKDKDEWYYLNEDGTMATNVTIDGCYLNNDGIIEEIPSPAKSNNETIPNNSSKSTTISPDRAIELICENDSIYINKLQNSLSSELGYNVQLVLEYYDEDSKEASSFNESCYGIALSIEGDDIEECTYLVGKQTGNVYVIPHQGGQNYYQIKNNQIIKTFNDGGYNWREFK